MVLCDREGRIYDVWISFGSLHEVRAFRERKIRSVWVRERVEICVVFGDRGYRGCEGVIVCDSREMRAKRQVGKEEKEDSSERQWEGSGV